MSAPRVAVIDFETEPIGSRPAYPPIPVGVAIKEPGKDPVYYAWGHPTENNCTREQARRALLKVWENSKLGLVFHNAKFDYDVATTHMGMPELPWNRIHDTLFLLFLYDPHAPSFALKGAAERLLEMPPEERDEVKEWVVANIPEARRKQSIWGQFICKAPGALVGRYAIGDVVRTDALFGPLYDAIEEAQMLPSYDRERELMPILLANERRGVAADLDAMVKDRERYGQALEDADNWLRKVFSKPDLNVDSDAEMAALLDHYGIVTEWELTPTGKKSTAKKNLTPDKFTGNLVDARKRTIATGQQIASVFGYRNRLLTCLSVFMDTWIEMASNSGGVIYTNWNQVRQTNGGDNLAGTRTGRLSSNPNFMNIPKSFEGKGDNYIHPAHAGLPELPLMRRYILADKYGKKPGVFLHRDYNQQEIRILAHFENGELCARYNEDPRLDIHTLVQDLIEQLTGRKFPRSAVKIVNFGKIYGMGVGKLAMGVGCTVDEARALSKGHSAALPGVAILDKILKQKGRNNEPITTWGGRDYYCEPPIPSKFGSGMQTFEYKLLNYLIQGSAADCTKTAVIEYHKAAKDGRFLVTVHDEINISAPEKAAKSEMKILREVMQSVKFNVPMLSDGKWGPNWGSLTKFEEK